MRHYRNPPILSTEQRNLLLLMQEIRYGRIENLSIRNGNPVFDKSTRVIRHIKFSQNGADTSLIQRRDLLDKPQVSELIGYIGSLTDGYLESLEIQDGLPFRMNIVEKLHA